ncbi:terminase family protein [Erythrobacter sp. F6033]|uniref:terminase large subunit domain-containing protein n=1 Tax=Erythrobacter sp. F6033 TaxID=2926401 RepID=UPI0032B1C307
MTARPAQLPPAGDWRVWLVMAGRGFGKTRAGSEWVRNIAETDCNARVALVSSSLAEARAVMVEGESGIMACSPPDRAPIFEASLRRLRWPNGAQAQIFSAAEPESFRGPQHSHALRAGPERVLCQSELCDDRWVASASCRRKPIRTTDKRRKWRNLQDHTRRHRGMDGTR